MPTAATCPVCEGRGFVMEGFYRSMPGCGWSSSSVEPEECRSCEGRGYVVLESPAEIEIRPISAATPVFITHWSPPPPAAPSVPIYGERGGGYWLNGRWVPTVFTVYTG